MNFLRIVFSLGLFFLTLAQQIQQELVQKHVPPVLDIFSPQEPHIKTWSDIQYQKENESRDRIDISYQNTQAYTFSLREPSEFIIAVGVDQTIKAVVHAYLQESGTYVEAVPTQGEEIRVIIYENRKTVLINQVFYQALGIEFQAKKGREYLVRFMKEGMDKLVDIHMQNYLTLGRTTDIIGKQHIGEHEAQTLSILNKFKTFLMMAQQNAVFSEHIANTVKSQTRQYMLYQIFEMILVILATVAQVFLIRKLLSNASVV